MVNIDHHLLIIITFYNMYAYTHVEFKRLYINYSLRAKTSGNFVYLNIYLFQSQSKLT